jgi:hypothetical protein
MPPAVAAAAPDAPLEGDGDTASGVALGAVGVTGGAELPTDAAVVGGDAVEPLAEGGLAAAGAPLALGAALALAVALVFGAALADALGAGVAPPWASAQEDKVPMAASARNHQALVKCMCPLVKRTRRKRS